MENYTCSMSGTSFNTGSVSVMGDNDPIRHLYINNDSCVDTNNVPCSSTQSGNRRTEEVVPSLNGDSTEDYDLSYVVLKYINEILMKEDLDDNSCIFQGSQALKEAEKSFYEVLGKKYPPSPDHQAPDLCETVTSCEENCYFVDHNSFASSSGLWCPNWTCDPSENISFGSHQSGLLDVDASVPISQLSYDSSCNGGTVNGCLVDSFESSLTFVDSLSDSQFFTQYEKEVEGANKCLSSQDYVLLDERENDFVRQDQGGGILTGENVNIESCGSRGKKNLHDDVDILGGGRNNKQSAVFFDSVVRSEIFDTVLLGNGGNNESVLRGVLQNGTIKSSGALNDSQSKGSHGGRPRGRKASKKKVVDLITLLTLCAQAVAADDRRTANEFLKKIRRHSSPTGDGMQRLAHYFADGLERRSAGSGTQVYTALMSFPIPAVDLLKAYQLYLAACPYRKISDSFSNKTIWNAAENATSLHIVDFGIRYGFQWPSLIQRLSSRPGGPPKLRITGIDLPHPGFRPSERVEETGYRLASFAETFRVPFEFHAIAQKWETVKIEDLNIREGEVLVVNCLYHFRNLLDETVVVNSPRDIVLNLIKKMNPHTFILGIVNGSYNAPFFITRFREALFHYSSLFDMLEANIPRDIPERMLLEKIIFGLEAMNVIACEAAERIERPETYKKWQIRNQRAGFRQLPLDEEMMNIATEWVKAYHKDFVIYEDSQWLLQGWKGRIVYALSTWKSAS